MTDNIQSNSKTAVLFWMLAFFTAMGVASWFSFSFNLDGVWMTVLMLLAMLLLIPMVSAAQTAAKKAGNITPAVRRYTRRFVAMSFAYVAVLLISVGLYNSYGVTGPVLWVLALLPSLPVMGMMWAIARLLIEEDDEYQRQKMVNSSLIATGITLIICTIWGFLETFGLVPHIWVWAVFPIWATSWGLGQLFMREKA